MFSLRRLGMNCSTRSKMATERKVGHFSFFLTNLPFCQPSFANKAKGPFTRISMILSMPIFSNLELATSVSPGGGDNGRFCGEILFLGWGGICKRCSANAQEFPAVTPGMAADKCINNQS